MGFGESRGEISSTLIDFVKLVIRSDTPFDVVFLSSLSKIVAKVSCRSGNVIHRALSVLVLKRALFALGIRHSQLLLTGMQLLYFISIPTIPTWYGYSRCLISVARGSSFEKQEEPACRLS